MPKVSVIIPTWNGAEHLDACLESLHAQTWHDCEILIVDDESADGTLEIAERHASRNPRIRIHRNARRLGLVANWRRGVELAGGEWIKFVFQDDLLDPACIEKLVNACIGNDSVMAFSYRAFLFEEGTPAGVREKFAGHRAQLASVYGGRGRIEPQWFSRTAASNLGCNLVGEPTVTLLHRSVFERFGSFDPVLIQLCDWEYWLRIISTVGAVVVPEDLAFFRVHGRSATALNIDARQYRKDALDALVISYRACFADAYAPFRKGVGAGVVRSLRSDCRRQAWLARRTAMAGVEGSGRSDSRLVAEWDEVASVYPALKWLALSGGLREKIRFARGAPRRLVRRIIRLCRD